MNTYETATILNDASDEQFAEVFAAYYKIHFKGKRDGNIIQDDMDFNIHELTSHIEKSLNEIIYSEEMDASAWWKDDKFFGRDTPKAKFLAQTPEFQQNRLMETAMRIMDLYTAMYTDMTDYMMKLELFRSWAIEYEYEYFETEDYENFWLEHTEKIFMEKLREEFGEEEVKLNGNLA